MTNDVSMIMKYISPSLRDQLIKLKSDIWEDAHEIRLTIGKPLLVCFNQGHIKLPAICDEKDIKETLLLLTDNSVYSANDKLASGFFTVEGGYRAGVCGTVVMNNGCVSAIKNISSISIRLKREIIGVADKVMQYIKKDGKIQNTLIVSPPKSGKTTLLRDIARALGNFHNVSIVDERSEIAGMYMGVPQNDVGIQTTVLDGCIKSVGIPIVIRSMAPEVIITDEIGSQEDADAIFYALSSGASIITSVHGDSYESLMRKPTLKSVVEAFEVIIILTNQGGAGTVSDIIIKGTTYD